MIKPIRSLKPISLKVDPQQLKLLEAVSRETHIPKSTLIREGISLVLRQHKEDIVSADLQQEIDSMIHEDKELLKKLA